MKTIGLKLLLIVILVTSPAAIAMIAKSSDRDFIGSWKSERNDCQWKDIKVLEKGDYLRMRVIMSFDEQVKNGIVLVSTDNSIEWFIVENTVEGSWTAGAMERNVYNPYAIIGYDADGNATVEDTCDSIEMGCEDMTADRRTDFRGFRLVMNDKNKATLFTRRFTNYQKDGFGKKPGAAQPLFRCERSDWEPCGAFTREGLR